MVFWASLVPHRRHRGETGVCRHGGKAGQDDTVHVEVGFDIGSGQSTGGCRCDPGWR